jgi:hypothetical protein
MAGTMDKDPGIAASVEGVGTGEAEIETFPGVPPEMVKYIRRQLEEATANGIEQGAKRIADTYGGYFKLLALTEILTAAAVVGLLIVALTRDSGKKE